MIVVDFLKRPLNIGDHVVFSFEKGKHLRLAKVEGFTKAGKVKVRWGDQTWATMTITASFLVIVPAP